MAARSSDAAAAPVAGALERRVELLERQVAALLEGARRPRGDDVDDLALLGAIARIEGGRTFTAADVWRHAAIADEDLRAHLAAAVVLSVRALGRRFRKLATRTDGDLRIVRDGDDRDGALWTIKRVSDR